MSIELTQEQIAEDRNELRRLKVDAKVEAVATTLYGYERDEAESNDKKGVTVLRRKADNGKLLVWSNKNDWDVVWNCRTRKTGTVLDLVQDESSVRLGRAREILRAFLRTERPSIKRTDSAATGAINGASPTASAGNSNEVASPMAAAASADDEPDRKKVKATLDKATWTPAPEYLRKRGLSVSLADDRFTGRYRTTKHGMVMFPHLDSGGLSGYELRGFNADGDRLKMFAKGGKRGLWTSTNIKAASIVVVVESAIDAMSHAELYSDWQAAYVSVAGEISYRQKPLLTRMIDTLSERATIVAAFDNDDSGEKHFNTLCKLTKHSLERLTPVSKDWTDDLEYCIRERG